MRGGEGGGVEEGVLDTSKGSRGSETEVTLKVPSSRSRGKLWLIAQVSGIFTPFGAQMFDVSIGPVVLCEAPFSDSLLSRHPSQYLVSSSSVGTSPKLRTIVGFILPRGTKVLEQSLK